MLCTSLIICCLNTLNEILRCWKLQPCTAKKSWDMDILNSNSYGILCSIALLRVKIKIKKTILKLLYIIDYLLLNTQNEILTSWKVQLYTHNQSLDMDILNSNSYFILCSIALMHVKTIHKLL